MSTSKSACLAQLLDQVALDLHEHVPETSSFSDFERGMTLLRHLDEGKRAALTAALREEPAFARLRGGWLQTIDEGQDFGDSLVPWLIGRRLGGVPAASLIDEAVQFGTSGACEIEDYSAVAGFVLKEPVSLWEDLQLLPWSHVPDSFQKRRFGGEDKAEAAVQPFRTERILPTAAIRVVAKERQVLFTSYDDAPRTDSTEIVSIRKTARDVVRCIAAVAVASPGILGGWTILGNPFADSLSGTSYSYYGHTIFDRAFSPKSPPVDDTAKLRGVFRNFEQFEEVDKPVLRIGIDRFSAALRRDGWTNKAIDLGISLEVLLLHNLPPHDRGELTTASRYGVRGF